MAANVYVDGFNLYYGCIRGTRYKWLDISQLIRLILPRQTIHRIRYFTALVKPRSDDPDKAQRQETYIRALRTIPHLEIHYGTFLSHPVRLPYVAPLPGGPKFAHVIKTGEKGSDVNLASHLLVDAFTGDCDAAIVISNDSDLLEPLRIARSRLDFRIGILNPHRSPSKELQRVATFYRLIRTGVLAGSQFPDQLRDAHGTITKPPSW